MAIATPQKLNSSKAESSTRFIRDDSVKGFAVKVTSSDTIKLSQEV